MNRINSKNETIEIISTEIYLAVEAVKIKIGKIPAMAIEPKEVITADGMIFLFSTDEEKGEWEELINLARDGETLSGFIGDPG
jgi:hypothetical protein